MGNIKFGDVTTDFDEAIKRIIAIRNMWGNEVSHITAEQLLHEFNNPSDLEQKLKEREAVKLEIQVEIKRRQQLTNC